MLGKDVVQDALNTIFLAIQDLIKLDKNINLAFGEFVSLSTEGMVNQLFC